ncbi:MAG: hypothetical protein A2606_02045 [Candidatus Yanofskybacteria bacterium RIFOXYD1_FULL_42_10]|uniref:Uncharacterized protein n=1 Tax=Candidatus Yanofskybacteria bacterium RIFOXYD1_FULL_42_10 TaxID=1802718 RepID=A0A1F8HUF8_9BACT|nr:MAG: hypothetical protein A3C64_01075 [Candidatus Yanofskybacteria bacterium RIFCSPHIGHO2_02_FULL_41_12]OGN41234.1 MAG: hypothetical protein A2606_02045 [Candidatus Yanofskybacteria bacterium RIFOXYD1_FULL_42_10]
MENLINLIRSRAAYRPSIFKEPLCITLHSAKGTTIILLGVFHSSFVAESSQVDLLQTQWNIFIKLYGNKIVLAEKPKPKAQLENFAETLKRFGESGAVHWLAQRDNIQSYCPEPDHSGVLKYLMKQFQAEDVVFAYILSTVEWRQKLSPPQTAQQMISSGITYWNRYTKLLKFTLTEEWFMNRFDREFPNTELEDDNAYRAAISSLSGKTIFNKIMTEKGRYRDIALLQAIKNDVDAGCHLFVVYGHTHIWAIESAVQVAIQNK